MMRIRTFRRAVGALVSCVLLGGLGLACGSKPKPARRGQPDAAVVKKNPDAGPRPTPPQRRIALGAGCSCVVRAGGDLSVEATRKALVARMDRLNDGLRSLMKTIDGAVPDEKKDRISNPAPLHTALGGLTCRLDCFLHQFRGATPALWTYLAVAARFLDEAQHAVGRLTVLPAGRPAGPSIAELTKLFNLAARTSNESIGLALSGRRVPTAQVGVDALSFRNKVRRWREKLRPVTSAFERRWLPLIQHAKPEGPALSQPRSLRVALARLQQELRSLADGVAALACRRGKGCAKPQAAWVTMGSRLKELRAHCERLARELRAAGPILSLAVGRRLSKSTTEAFAATEKAALNL